MKRFILLFVVALAAVPLFAQSRSVDLIGRASWVDPNGNGTIHDGQIDAGRIDFKSDIGYGAAINVFWSPRISTEFGITAADNKAALRSTNPLIVANAGNLRMIPITATLQFHPSPEAKIDPYVGAGAAYVMFDKLDNSSDLANLNIRSIDFKDDAGFVVNAGLNFDITPRLALNLDAKYVPVKSSAHAVFVSGPGQSSDISINPLILSAGLGFQF